MTKPSLEETEQIFHNALGSFYSAWNAAETFVDFGIGKFLNLKHEETHLFNSAMEFSRKANVLRAIVARSKDPKKEKIIKAVNWLQNSNRNLFSHSTVQIYPDKIVFFQRTKHGVYSAKEYPYTAKEFVDYVQLLVQQSLHLSEGLGTTDDVVNEFLAAASKVKSSA